jgi:hypothetical protein
MSVKTVQCKIPQTYDLLLSILGNIHTAGSCIHKYLFIHNFCCQAKNPPYAI